MFHINYYEDGSNTKEGDRKSEDYEEGLVKKT